LPEQGEVIDLVYYHEKSVKETAEIVGIAEATVKTRMFYGRQEPGRSGQGSIAKTVRSRTTSAVKCRFALASPLDACFLH
jgi:DNA-directed RNA polymerase specialized sigma24 family protein